MEFLREVLRGIVRESSAFIFRKNVLENKKTTLRLRYLFLYLSTVVDSFFRNRIMSSGVPL
nr:hypothetical protein [Oceanobacillus bengalensis]